MNKVYVLAPHESWIVDRFVQEWNVDNRDISVADIHQADVIWLLADWCWDHVPGYVLKNRKVITTIHHIVPEKFDEAARATFRQRDWHTTVYHVPNHHTEAFIRPLTQKPIHVISYWANQHIFTHSKDDKAALRRKHGVPEDAFVIGSFQRDTEGAGISGGTYQPKLEKGPDLLADFVEAYQAAHGTPHVLLAGWRRQYLISRLERAHVPYTYLERPEHTTINELYQCLDLYPVTARYEGGPQSLVECGLLGIPCVSRPVGIAEAVLPAEAINDNVFLAKPAVPNVEAWKLPMGYQPYRDLIEAL